MSIEPVVVKAFRGIALNRWLIGICGEVAVITNEAGAEAVRGGRVPAHTVGFPKGDVFQPSGARIDDGIIPNWSEFRPRF
jgi:hypothetical protein